MVPSRVGCVVATLLLAACSNAKPDVRNSVTPVLGTVVGSVVAAPGCPVQQAASPCPPRPVAGAEVAVFDADRQRGSTRTDDNGQFRFSLPFGHYRLRATNVGGLATVASTEVDVGAATATVTLTVDSGIR